MIQVKVTHSVTLPDPVKIARCKRAPELGPRVLFFSGGSALKPLSKTLINYTHHSIHLITPFDSGGSSAVIRRAFDMLAVGDLRNRLMALADQSAQGNPEVYDLFSYRFSKELGNDELLSQLEKMANGKHALIMKVPNPMRRIIRNHLHSFLDAMPADFNLRGASIGNLILTAGYLNNRRHIEPVVYMFSKLAEVRGTVRPITGLSFHLAAYLDDGSVMIGQHNLTGKKFRQSGGKICNLFLSKSDTRPDPVSVTAKKKIQDLIKSSELICYPVGSFYTSLIANLLVSGVGQAVSRTSCPKVFIPNPFPDSEQHGLSLYDSVETLLRYVKKTSTNNAAVDAFLNFMIIDSRSGAYRRPHKLSKIRDMGIQVIDIPMITGSSRPRIDEAVLCEVLLSLV